MRGFSEKFPIALGGVGVLQFDRRESIGNLARQQVPVLKADVLGGAFQVDVRPSALLKAVSILHTRVGWYGALGLGQGRRTIE